MRKALLVAAVAAAVWTPPASAASRLVYASDWLGPMQVFAVDPAGRQAPAQITFDRPTTCFAWAIPCGFVDPLPSPDGRWIAYCELSAEGGLWLATFDGRSPRRLATGSAYCAVGPADAVRYATVLWSPDSKELAYAEGRNARFVRVSGNGHASGRWWRGWPRLDKVISPDHRWIALATDSTIAVTERRTGRTRVLVRRAAFSLTWSPDSRALAYVEGKVGLDVADTGDVGIVTLNGRDRKIVDSGGAYGGQIEAVAWARVPQSAHYRPPERANGVFARGPVAHLAADGAHVAFAACLHVFTWTPGTDVVRQLDRRPPDALGGPLSGCAPREGRAEIYDLALAGDRVAWGEKTTGLTYTWFLRQASLSPFAIQYTLASGRNSLGSHFDGAGGLAGAGGTLLYSVWNTRSDPASGEAVTATTLFRATPSGCPCPAIGYAAVAAGGREVFLTPIVALDTDGTRVAALRFDSLVLLDASGSELLSLPLKAAAAQVADDDLVVAIPNELRVYSAQTGAVRHAWPLRSGFVGRDCRFYSEPRCPYEAELQLQDAARGLAAYVLNGRIHVVRLADGRDADVAFGSEARFMEAGLVYVDGARIRLVPYSSLGAFR